MPRYGVRSVNVSRTLGALLALLVTMRDGQATASQASDAAIYKAVFTTTMRPEIVRLLANGDPAIAISVLAFDHTVPMCRAGVVPEMPVGCLPTEPLDAFAAELGKGVRFAGRLDGTARAELNRLFREHNTQSQPFARPDIRELVVIPPNEYQQRASSAQAGTVRFSAIAYSTDGHALVYGSYVCGGMCGYGWLFLLERSGAEWRSVANELLWIS